MIYVTRISLAYFISWPQSQCDVHFPAQRLKSVSTGSWWLHKTYPPHTDRRSVLLLFMVAFLTGLLLKVTVFSLPFLWKVQQQSWNIVLHRWLSETINATKMLFRWQHFGLIICSQKPFKRKSCFERDLWHTYFRHA